MIDTYIFWYALDEYSMYIIYIPTFNIKMYRCWCISIGNLDVKYARMSHTLVHQYLIEDSCLTSWYYNITFKTLLHILWYTTIRLITQIVSLTKHSNWECITVVFITFMVELYLHLLTFHIKLTPHIKLTMSIKAMLTHCVNIAPGDIKQNDII